QARPGSARGAAPRCRVGRRDALRRAPPRAGSRRRGRAVSDPPPLARREDVRTVAGLWFFAWSLTTFVAGYALLTMYELSVLPVPAYVPAQHEGLLHWVLDPWQHWDGQWFLRIAQRGYFDDDGSAAFLPAYPWLVRLVTRVTGGDSLVAACLVSWA